MAVLGFIFWTLVAHFYSPSQVGLASSLITAKVFISYVSLLGFDSTFIRFLPKTKRRNEHLDTGLLLVATAALVASTLFVIGAPHFAPRLALLHSNPWFSIGFVVLCVGAAVNLLTDSVFIAYRAASYNLVIDGFIGSSAQLFLPIVLTGIGAFGIYAAQGIAGVVAMLCSLYCLMRYFAYRPRFVVQRQTLREVVHYSSGNYGASLLNTVPTFVLPLVVLNRLGSANAGYYYLASMIANMLFTIVYAVAQSLFAEGSYEDRELFVLVKKAGNFLALTILPASILLALLGPLLLRVFGDGYSEHAGHLLVILAAIGPVLSITAVGAIVLRITKQTQALLIINTLYAVSVCGLALLWGSRGLVWVAVAWLCGQVITAVATYTALGWHYWRRAS